MSEQFLKLVKSQKNCTNYSIVLNITKTKPFDSISKTHIFVYSNVNVLRLNESATPANATSVSTNYM